MTRLMAVAVVAVALAAGSPDAFAQDCTLSAPYPTVRSGPERISGSLPLTASSSCPSSMTASSTASWLQASSASNGSSGAFVSIFTDQNFTGASRSAVVVVNGQALITFTQHPAGCVASVTPASHTFPATGGTFTFQVQTTTADCFWGVTGFPGPPPFFNPLGPGWLVRSGANSYGLTGHLNPHDIGTRSFQVAASSNAFNSTDRSATLTFGGGPSATVTQSAPTCQFAFSPASVTIPANGGSATVSLTGTGSDCSYATAVTIGAPWITVTAGASGAAPATVTIAAAANATPFERTGQVVAVNGVLGVTQAGPPVAVDFGSSPARPIAFGAARQPAGTVRVTAAEPIRLTNDVEPNASWTATASQSWILLSPASGTTPGTLRIAIDPVALAAQAPGFLTGFVDIFSSTAPQTPRRLNISVNYYNGVPGTQEPFVFGAPPFGVIDTPTDGATGLSGAVPITGWAIDRVGLTNVRIYRAPVAGEPQALVYVGDALRVFGSRPDVLPFYAGFPESRLAGWGYMLLSNVLPNGGNGTFTFSAYAEDVEGNNTLIGSKTVTFDNGNAIKPFGTIDSPAQGETVSGTLLNRGWVLTPQPKTIPLDGSTINVYIDGALVGPATTYNAPRPDVKAYFPGLNNSDGPEARRAIDTTLLADGVHTIAWGVIDNEGVAEGIGSRYFTVQNGAASLVAAPGDTSRSAATVSTLPVLGTDVWSRSGVDETGWAMRIDTGASGDRTLRVPRGQRIELFLDPALAAPCGTYDGHLLSGGVAGPLPMGASLDARRGIFRWQPGAETGGAFAFVFVQRGCDAVERRIPVTVRVEGAHR